jgi:GNAT superfamily N-acetyltransferase
MTSNLENYYSRSRASGIWILELDGRTIGLVAIDASLDAEVARLEDVPKGTKRKASHTAVIRHFYVDEQYRPTGIQKDLLDHALKAAFSADSSLARVKTTSSPLREYTTKALTEAGFKSEGVAATIGLLRWKLHTLVLPRGALQNSGKSRK